MARTTKAKPDDRTPLHQLIDQEIAALGKRRMSNLAQLAAANDNNWTKTMAVLYALTDRYVSPNTIRNMVSKAADIEAAS